MVLLIKYRKVTRVKALKYVRYLITPELRDEIKLA